MSEESATPDYDREDFLRNLKAQHAVKCLNVYAKVRYVKKDGTNSKQGYKYAEHPDVCAAIRDACVENKLFTSWSLAPSTYTNTEYTTGSGGTGLRAEMESLFEVVDTETGFVDIKRYPAFGMGSDDKTTNKAETSSDKNAMLRYFGVATDNEDPDKGEESVGPAKSNYRASKPAVAPNGDLHDPYTNPVTPHKFEQREGGKEWDGTVKMKSGKYEGKMWKDTPDDYVAFLASKDNEVAKMEVARRKKVSPSSMPPENNELEDEVPF